MSCLKTRETVLEGMGRRKEVQGTPTLADVHDVSWRVVAKRKAVNAARFCTTANYCMDRILDADK